MPNAMKPWIHPKAHVEWHACSIGAGTKIHQFASVTRGTVLGEDCTVWPFAMLDGPIIGDRCIIASGTAIGAGFKIGSNCFIGPNVTFCNDMWPRVDKDGYDDAALRSGEKFAIIVEPCVSIGAGAVILPGVRIGAGTLIGAGVILNRPVGAGLVVTSNRGNLEFSNRDEYVETRMRWAL